MKKETIQLKKEAKEVKSLHPQYDPRKQYQWDPNATFEIGGNEFGLILNTLRAFTGTEEAMRMRMALDANEIMEGMMKTGVETGKIKEVTEG